MRDQAVHRDEDELEEDEEQQQVERDEGADHADLKSEQQSREGSSSAISGCGAHRVDKAQRGKQRSQQEQWQ